MSVLPAPFVRELRLGSQGTDVTAVKRALVKSGERPRTIEITGKLGSTAVAEIRAFQKRHYLHVDGVYGAATHRQLVPYIDSYGRHLLAVERAAMQPTPVDAKRHLIVAAALLGIAHRDEIHYTQGPLRMEGVTKKIRPPGFPTHADCSAFATWCYFVAGAEDPNGLGYNGQGYTGTLAQHGKLISGHGAPGDLVLYRAPAPFEHVAISLGDGTVISHGSEAGPYHLPIDYRPDRAQVRSYL